MYRVEPPPIIRSSDCTYSFWYLSNLAATCCNHGWAETRLNAPLRVYSFPCLFAVHYLYRVLTLSDNYQLPLPVCLLYSRSPLGLLLSRMAEQQHEVTYDSHHMK
jgi:hypothetical protein